MTMLLSLIVQLLHRARRFLLAAGVLLAAFQVVLILQANSIQASNSFAKTGDLVPSFAREVLGPSFVMFLTFRGIVCLGYFHPVVEAAIVGDPKEAVDHAALGIVAAVATIVVTLIGGFFAWVLARA